MFLFFTSHFRLKESHLGFLLQMEPQVGGKVGPEDPSRFPLLPRLIDGTERPSWGPVFSETQCGSTRARPGATPPVKRPARYTEVQRRSSPPRRNTGNATGGPTELERQPTPSASWLLIQTAVREHKHRLTFTTRTTDPQRVNL